MPDSLFSALHTGLKRSLLRPNLLIGLWLLSLGTAAFAMLPVGIALYAGLSEHPAAIKLARGQADVLWGEILMPLADTAPLELGPLLLFAIASGLLLFWLLEVLLSGGFVAALLRPGHPAHAPPGRIFSRAIETASAMLRIECLGLVTLRLPLVLFCGAVAYLIGKNLQLLDATAEKVMLCYGPLLFVALLFFSAGSNVLSYARAFYLAHPPGETSAAVALRKALALTLSSRARMAATLGLALVSVLGYGMLILFGRLVAAWLDSALFVFWAFVVRQLSGLLRAGLALTVLAAATEVWHEHGKGR